MVNGRMVALLAMLGAGLWGALGTGSQPSTGPAGRAAEMSSSPASAIAPAITLEEARRIYARGLDLQRQGNIEQAIEQFRQATAPGSTCAEAFNHLAWLRATDDRPRLRDGPEAVRLAEQAHRLVADRLPGMDVANILDTLGAAYAEAGRFDQAVATAEKAAALAESLGSRGSGYEFRQRKSEYEAGKPHHEPAATEHERPSSRPTSRYWRRRPPGAQTVPASAPARRAGIPAD